MVLNRHGLDLRAAKIGLLRRRRRGHFFKQGHLDAVDVIARFVGADVQDGLNIDGIIGMEGDWQVVVKSFQGFLQEPHFFVHGPGWHWFSDT
jgi:hypothetical protein